MKTRNTNLSTAATSLQHGENSTSLLETSLRELGPLSRFGKWFVALVVAVIAFGLVALIYQLKKGLAVTAMTDYFSWGVYIINFVFFIGISMAGSLISAILRLTGAEWRKPITRLAEAITVFALLVAAAMIIVDMGRPDRFLFTIIHGRVQSPILWDIFSLTTYLAGSVLYLYLSLIPDFAILRDVEAGFAPWRRKLYTTLALGWRGTPEQHHRLEHAITVMSIVIIPVAISIHTVTSWIFGMTLRPGWHSTIIGPDFVIGALYSGIAAVITVMAILRRVYRLERVITKDHFVKLGWMLLVSSAAYMYFVVNEYMGPVYTHEESERKLLQAIFEGNYAIHFWTMTGVGLVIPALLLALPWTRTIGGIVTASVCVNIGMWLKRFIIVVPTLSAPFVPVELSTGKYFGYVPTWVEWAITAGGFACFVLFYIAFTKFIPIVSMWETQPPGGLDTVQGAPPAVGHPRAGGGATAALRVILVLATWFGVTLASPAIALEMSANKPTIALTTGVEEGKKMFIATVTLDGKPVESAKVSVSVKRTFGMQPMGADETLDDGTIAIPFPSDLPGSASGQIDVIASITAPPEYAGIQTRQTLDGARRTALDMSPAPRTLWAQNAPWGLIAVITTLLALVWGTYSYVLTELIKIKKAAKA